MLKRALFISLNFIALAVMADDSQKIDSKVQKVIVFLNGAQVTRTAKVSISPGTSSLVFQNISSDIDAQSIQVQAGGDFTILSVKNELNYLNEEAKQKNIEDLREQQKAIRDKISLKNNLLTIDEQEENMLLKNQVVTGENSSLDIVKLKQALDFQTATLTEIKQKEQTLNNEIVLLNTDLQKYDNQIADITRGRSNITSNILVIVSSKTALQAEFTLKYVVHNASWYPTYDIRAKDVNSPLSISYQANVSQQCGEDWKNIKLTLSTGNPSVSGSKPLLSPYYLNFGMIYSDQADKVTSVSGTVFSGDDNKPLPGASIKIKGTSIGAITDVNGNYTIQIPGGNSMLAFSFIGFETVERVANSSSMNIVLPMSKQELNEVVVVGYGTEKREDVTGAVSSMSSDVMIRGASSLGYSAKPILTTPIIVNNAVNQTNIEFNIDNPYSIPSDGKQYTVEINQVDLDASYTYAVAPKLSTDVFLSARLTDWNKYNFLSGEANLFFEGTFIGKSLLDVNATQDTLDISLGTDKNIVVTRTLQQELTKNQTIGSNKKDTRDWITEIKNRKGEPINLLVEDQVPVSQNSSIEVETQQLSAGQLDKNTGKIAWALKLAPQDDKKLELKYQVKYPKDQSVIVE